MLLGAAGGLLEAKPSVLLVSLSDIPGLDSAKAPTDCEHPAKSHCLQIHRKTTLKMDTTITANNNFEYLQLVS